MSKQMKTRIESYEVTPDGTLKISALFRIFQKIAGDDLDSAGLTYDALRDSGIVFVLTKMSVEFMDNIGVYDEINVITRPRGCKGAVYIRDYDVYKGDTRVAYCSSQWVIIDFSTRKILRPSTIAERFLLKDDFDDIYPIENKKFRFKSEDLTKIDTRRIYYSQLDRNEHMNNTFYPDMVLDYLPCSFRDGLKGKKVTVHYTTEITAGEEMDIFTGISGEGFCIMAVNTATEKEVFSALVTINN